MLDTLMSNLYYPAAVGTALVFVVQRVIEIRWSALLDVRSWFGAYLVVHFSFLFWSGFLGDETEEFYNGVLFCLDLGEVAVLLFAAGVVCANSQARHGSGDSKSLGDRSWATVYAALLLAAILSAVFDWHAGWPHPVGASVLRASGLVIGLAAALKRSVANSYHPWAVLVVQVLGTAWYFHGYLRLEG